MPAGEGDTVPWGKSLGSLGGVVACQGVRGAMVPDSFWYFFGIVDLFGDDHPVLSASFALSINLISLVVSLPSITLPDAWEKKMAETYPKNWKVNYFALPS